MISLLLGEAYGFFNCYAPKAIIQAGLPGVIQRSDSRGLEVSLMELKKFVSENMDSALLKTILESEVYPIVPSGYSGPKDSIPMAGLKYVIKATSVGLKNEKVADELGMVLNSLYETYYNKGLFYVVIAWEENGEYCLSK